MKNYNEFYKRITRKNSEF